MNFGLFNVQASFQSYINKILAKKFHVFIMVYLDNIFIYTKDECQSLVEIIQWVLNLLKKNGLFTKLEKSQFYQNEVCFLEYVVSSHEI